MVKNLGCLMGLLVLAINTFSQKADLRQQDLQILADNVFHLSEVMLHDVASPPAASRVYAYAMLGAYEVAFAAKSQLPDLNQKFRVNPGVQKISAPRKMDLSFCANYALLEVGRQLMPSGFLLEDKKKRLIENFKTSKKLSEKEIGPQVRYAMEIAGQVVRYAKTDGYNKLSTFIRYKPRNVEGHWYPTPPAYMAAVEPQWKTIRPFYLDSAEQFAPPPPAPFSTDTASSFYLQMKEVYNLTRKMTDEQREISNFWDCNPFAVAFSGHMAMGIKKISPGGHWMGITGIACKRADISLDSAIFIHTMVATTLHDAFISCWHEKYRSDRIRPEAAINKYLDPEWRPLLQTPPFPEYTSGHSVVSSSVAVLLTYLLGEDFSFTDTSEVVFGLPERRFKSFQHAANEAAISRLYGGIHFRDACEQGLVQGRRVGEFILNNLLDNPR